jgi:hypothetical protein
MLFSVVAMAGLSELCAWQALCLSLYCRLGEDGDDWGLTSKYRLPPNTGRSAILRRCQDWGQVTWTPMIPSLWCIASPLGARESCFPVILFPVLSFFFLTIHMPVISFLFILYTRRLRLGEVHFFFFFFCSAGV